ncbi:MAG: hydroxypyruvate isomerase, partial [Gemmatimonadaceae bacterium]
MNRRLFVSTSAAAGAASLIGVEPANAAQREHSRGVTTFKHSVTRWPFRQFTVEELARTAKELKMASVELLEPDEWAIARRHGLTCAMGYATVPDPGTRL